MVRSKTSLGEVLVGTNVAMYSTSSDSMLVTLEHGCIKVIDDYLATCWGPKQGRPEIATEARSQKPSLQRIVCQSAEAIAWVYLSHSNML